MSPTIRLALASLGAVTVAACSSGGGDGGPSGPTGPTGPVVAQVVIDRSSVFLTAPGASAQLAAVALDANGLPVAAAVTWTSSTPAQVRVDAAGAVFAETIGSAQIFAEAGGVRSLPALVLVAEPAPGALLVRDDQVVAIGPPLGLGPDDLPGMGTEYEVTLSGLAAPPEPGTVVLPAGLEVFGGKVVSTRAEGANVVVTLALAPLYELLARYDYGWSIALGPFAAAHATAAAEGPAKVFSTLAPLDAAEPFRPFSCDGSVEAGLADRITRVTPSVDLLLELFGQKPEPDQPPTYTRRAVTGTLSLEGEASLAFKPNITASGECLAQYPIRIPVGGLLALLVMPQVRIGVGAGVEASLVVAEGKVGLKGTLSSTLTLGIECGGATPDCRGLDSYSTNNRLEPVVDIPRVDQMHVEVSAQVFAFVGLDAVFFLTLNAPIVEGRFGPKQSFDMGKEEDQLTNPGYASSYQLALEGEVKPGRALQEAINAIFPGPAAVTFKAKASAPVSHSPTGTLSVDKTVTGPRQPVTIAVDLGDVDYFLLGYNVLEVQIFKKREDEPEFTRLATLAPSTSGSQTRFNYVWTPTEADVGVNDLAALVMTQLDPLVPLHEVAADSRKQVDVKCFSAPAAGLGIRATTCRDEWVGSASYRITTPGAPDSWIQTTGSLRWQWVENTAFGPSYRATGTLQLEMADPPGCTLTLTPHVFTYDGTRPNDSSTLGIYFVTDPPQYGFGLQTLVDFNTLADCPPDPPVETEFRGFPLGLVGNGTFTTPGDVTFSGSTDDGSVATSWSFSRP